MVLLKLKKMKLYGPTSRSHRIAVTAKYCSIRLDYVPVTMGETNKTEEYLKMNPFGKVPMLVCDDANETAVFESNAICRYLCSVSGEMVYPKESGGAELRAKIDGFMDSFNQLDASGPGWLYPIIGIGKARGVAYDEINEERTKKTCRSFLTSLEQHLKKTMAEKRGAFLVPERGFTLADIVGASSCENLFLHLIPENEWNEEYPAVKFWLETVYALPEWLEAVGKMTCCQEPMRWEGEVKALKNLPIDQTENCSWSAAKVRNTFTSFFESKHAHTIVPSSPVVPHDDPTLLFANAGMNQFKPIFLGTCDPKSPLYTLKRVTDSQKCIRAGGKHNDLDDVGKDTYHHTFFEMLGNWSFGDYFKEGAISMAWELLTEVYKIDPDRLYATYFGGDPKQGLEPDLEARDIWLKFLPASKVLPFDCADNFWEMGDTGPCGPCTEIHFDRIGNRDASSLVNMDDPNCLEIWNLVFIQYNREEGGVLKPLPSKHVDTGMGFERLASCLQDRPSNYDTDVFLPIFREIQRVTGSSPYTGLLGVADAGEKDMAYRVVADHVRTLTVAIADGASPGSDGRNYVLRRVLRRAVRFGREKLNAKQGFFHKLVPTVVKMLGETFPEIKKEEKRVIEIIAEEEESFGKTLLKGIEKFKKIAEGARGENRNVISGVEAFLLWESFGFPNDLTEIMCEENGLTLNNEEFDQVFKAAQEKSRMSSKKKTGVDLLFQAEATAWLSNNNIATTNDSFKYVENVPKVDTTVKAILTSSDGFVQSTEGQSGPFGLILESTPFYAESGGQVSDTGSLNVNGKDLSVSEAKAAAGYILHVLSDDSVSVSVGDACTAQVDVARRSDIMPNHTMTHVVNFALREVLGNDVNQKGSVVDDEKLRFDFSHNKPVTAKQIQEAQDIVNSQIKENLSVHTREVALTDAQKINGLRAVFGEVYPDPVRVVSVGPAIDDLLSNPSNEAWAKRSIEFCGGTHLKSTAEAEDFAIIEEVGTAKGIRRITAATKGQARQAFQNAKDFMDMIDATAKITDLTELSAQLSLLKGSIDDAEKTMPFASRENLRELIVRENKRYLDEKKKAAAEAAAKAIEQLSVMCGEASSKSENFLVANLGEGLDAKVLGECAQSVAAKGLSCALFATNDGKAVALCSVPSDVKNKTNEAKNWLDVCLKPLGGKGGGKKGVAQGQGPNAEAMTEAMNTAAAFAKMSIK